MAYDASRFPDIFQKMVERLNTTCPNEVVGVECNSASNLCALVSPFGDVEGLRILLKDNMWLAHTVWTNWRGCFFIWVRVSGWRPQNCILPSCLWIADGILPAVEVAGPDYYYGGFPDTDYGSTIKQIKFSEIKWSPNLHEEFLLMRLEDEFGPLLQMSDQHPVLSLTTASRFIISRLGLRYRYQTDSFTMIDDVSGKPVILTKNRLAETIQGWLSKKAVAAGMPPLPEPMVAEVITTIIKRIAIGQEEGLKQFLNGCVSRQAGASVTMAELLAGYQRFCEDEGAALLPARKFYQAITASLRLRFGVAKSHDIGRRSPSGMETDKSGFRNISLKAERSDTSDASDVSDTSDAS